jgi:hypothetical protein
VLIGDTGQAEVRGRAVPTLAVASRDALLIVLAREALAAAIHVGFGAVLQQIATSSRHAAPCSAQGRVRTIVIGETSDAMTVAITLNAAVIATVRSGQRIGEATLIRLAVSAAANRV